jgi:hypothetical protein
MKPDRLGTLCAAAACLALVAWFWVRGEQFIAANGPTFDEPAHLAAGYGYWTAGEFKLNPEHPPLLKLLWSFPLLFTDAPPFPHSIADESKLNHWRVGNAWLFEGGVPPRRLLDPARRVNLALGSALVLLVGWVAYRVWGSRLAAVAGCAFAATDPTLLALSCVLTTDLGLALFGLSTCYLLWEYTAAPSRPLLVAVGVSLGLMLGSKFSAVGLAAGVGLTGLVFVLRGGALAVPGRRDARGVGPALELAVRLSAIAAVAIAATYAFVNFFEWGKGLKFQLTRGAHGDGVLYLNGVIARAGWFHYFLVALAVKLPPGLLLAAGASLLANLASGRRKPAVLDALHPLTTTLSPASGERETAADSRRPLALFLVIPPLVFFALASYSRVNMGVRVVLPVLPFLYLLAAGLAVPGCCRLARLGVLVVCLSGCAVAAQRANPHEIAYFNELAGGPVGGAEILADSNLDWGQGLPALKEWMDREGVPAVYLAYFGTDRPEAHGIRFEPLPAYGRVGSAPRSEAAGSRRSAARGDEQGGEVIPADSPRHVVAVSANHLLGLYLKDPGAYSWLRGRTPHAVLGGCVYVFDLTGDADAVRRVRSLGVQ